MYGGVGSTHHFAYFAITICVYIYIYICERSRSPVTHIPFGASSFPQLAVTKDHTLADLFREMAVPEEYGRVPKVIIFAQVLPGAVYGLLFVLWFILGCPLHACVYAHRIPVFVWY